MSHQCLFRSNEVLSDSASFHPIAVIINVKTSLKSDPLPCFWKCTLSTAHLPEVKIETGGGGQERELLLTCGKERERVTDNTTTKKLSPRFFCWWKQNPLQPSVSLCGTHMNETLRGCSACDHVHLSVCVCVCDYAGMGPWKRGDGPCFFFWGFVCL